MALIHMWCPSTDILTLDLTRPGCRECLGVPSAHPCSKLELAEYSMSASPPSPHYNMHHNAQDQIQGYVSSVISTMVQINFLFGLLPVVKEN